MGTSGKTDGKTDGKVAQFGEQTGKRLWEALLGEWARPASARDRPRSQVVGGQAEQELEY